jgi:hypothetical protein
VSPTSDTRTTSVRELHPRYAGGSWHNYQLISSSKSND